MILQKLASFYLELVIVHCINSTIANDLRGYGEGFLAPGFICVFLMHVLSILFFIES